MSINRGKQFESLIQEQLEKVPEISIDRLYDVTTGYKNQNNPCDFIVYKYPHILYLECKTTNTSTLNFKFQIRENQLAKLTKKSKIEGVVAGILCWFVKNDKTIFIPIQYINELIQSNKKSFNANNFDTTKVIELNGYKKRIFFEYDLEDFLRSLRYE